MVDTKDLKSFAVRRGGSNPSTPKYNHVALIFCDGEMLASSNNNGRHAEVGAIEVAKLFKLEFIADKLILISLRVTKRGILAMAKPCRNCQMAIKRFGIRKVMYSNEKGVIVKL